MEFLWGIPLGEVLGDVAELLASSIMTGRIMIYLLNIINLIL